MERARHAAIALCAMTLAWSSAGYDGVVEVDIGLAHRPSRSWAWLLRVEFLLPSLCAATIALLLLQRRANRAALLAA